MPANDAYIRSAIKNHFLTVLMFIGIVIGLVSGTLLLVLRDREYTSRELMYIKLPGDLLLQMLQSIAIPLAASCVVVAIVNIDMSIFSRMGIQLMIYIILTKMWAVSFGFFLASAMNLGEGQESSHSEGQIEKNDITLDDYFLDILRNVFPRNMLEMNMKTHETVLIKPNTSNSDIRDWPFVEGGNMRDSANMFGIINCAMFLGAALGAMKMSNHSLVNLFTGMSEILMVITDWILWISPLLIIFLLAGQLASMGNLTRLIHQLGYYIVVTLTAYILQMIVVYPFIRVVFTMQNPYPLYKDYFDAIVTAFATGSSLATLPVAIRCLEENSKEDSRVVRFVIPVASAISKDGAAIYMGIVTVYIADLFERNLSIEDMVPIVFLGAAASLTCAGVPFTAIVTAEMVLNGMNLPTHDLATFLAVDWIIDRCSTVVNVTGDAIAVQLLTTFNRKFLQSRPERILSDTSN